MDIYFILSELVSFQFNHRSYSKVHILSLCDLNLNFILDDSTPKKHASVLWNREVYELEIVAPFKKTDHSKSAISSALRGDTSPEVFSRWAQLSVSDGHLFKSTQLEVPEFIGCLPATSSNPPASTHPSTSSSPQLSISASTPKLSAVQSLAKDSPAMPSPSPATILKSASAASVGASAGAAPAHFSSEWANLFFHRQYHPACAFQLELQWLVASGFLLGEMVRSDAYYSDVLPRVVCT